MKLISLKGALASCLIMTCFTGCGAEAPALIAIATQTAGAAGAVAGTALALEGIKNLSVDTAKKKAELKEIQNRTRRY